jgi:hypothetical protein
MTPQERQLVKDLFDRLATLEGSRRDPEAEALIADGLKRAPHAAYALVQTALVQDEALRAADERLRELEGGEQQGQGSFLDNMRDAFLGRREESRGSVPSVRPGAVGGARWNDAASGDYPPQQPPQGGSFLGTAAASAAGVIGGAMLLNSFRTMFGGTQGQQQGMLDQGGRSPWSGDSAAGSDLARQAGADDIGRNGKFSADQPNGERAGFFDTAQADDDGDDYDDSDSDFDFDDSDTA